MNKYKKCTECMYFSLNQFFKEESICFKFGKLKKPEFEYAIDCRKDVKKCGPDGKGFIYK